MKIGGGGRSPAAGRRGDSLDFYRQWPAPAVIVSDGGYGILGFEGDTSDHLGLPDWCRRHIAAWRRRRRGFGGEIDPAYFRRGVRRLIRETSQPGLA